MSKLFFFIILFCLVLIPFTKTSEQTKKTKPKIDKVDTVKTDTTLKINEQYIVFMKKMESDKKKMDTILLKKSKK